MGAPMPPSGPATTGFPPPVADPGAPLGPPPVPSSESSGSSVRLRRVAGVALWACVLAFGGLGVAVAAFVRILSHAPGWFEPIVVVVGVIGIGLTAAAFPVARRGGLPWMFLGGATVVLIVAAVLTALVG